MSVNFNWKDCQYLLMWACGNFHGMTLGPTLEQIAWMDADQLRAILLSQIEINSKLQAKVVEVQSTNTELQVVVKYKDAVIPKITLELASHERFQFSKKAVSLTVE